MYATNTVMNRLNVPRNWAMLAFSGSIWGMTRNNNTSAIVTSGIKKIPQNFDIYPSTSPAAFQCEGMGSGSWAYRISPAISAIAIKMDEMIREVLVDIVISLSYCFT
jgi:hypothetical protein